MPTESVIDDMSQTLVALLGQHLTTPSGVTARGATADDFEELHRTGGAARHVSVFLYRIAVNPEMRNMPGRTVPGPTPGSTRTTRQPLPLELCYLITAWASDHRTELQIIGKILQVFYDHAELGRAALVGESWEQDDTVQLVLDSLPLEDHYRIWDTSKIPYRLSLTYIARVVHIRPSEERETPRVTRAQIGQGLP